MAVLLLVGSVFGYRAFKARTEERAHGQLAAAVAILNAPVAAPAPGAAPAPAAPGTYATEAARADAALKQLLSTADAYKGTDAGMRARYYAASLYAETNRPKEAGDAYIVVRDQAGASTLLGRMASLGLASMQVRQKQFDPAIKALQELVAAARWSAAGRCGARAAGGRLPAGGAVRGGVADAAARDRRVPAEPVRGGRPSARRGAAGRRPESLLTS